ncbi:AI-2E family transporter [Modicisalibacter coralii]|uniref:AI-2E family transporter n=1 Tax=Modicisalibacter coralii TaxID=2304602 RepID=UPI00100ACF9C|nr:AI-2E family transporter [Halomonas coralii]
MSDDDEARVAVFARRIWTVAGIAVTVLLVSALVWFGYPILLLVYAGLLLALALSVPAGWLEQHTFLDRRGALVTVMVSLSLLLAAFVLKFSMSLTREISQLVQVLPQSMSGLEHWLRQSWLGDYAVTRIERETSLAGIFRHWSPQVTTLFSTTLGSLLNVAVVVFIGLFVAFEPRRYRQGLMHLVRPAWRARTGALLDDAAHRLTWWLLGRLASMSVVGGLSGLGLWLLDVPMAFTLGLLAGLLSFIPYLGPVLSAVPASLVAFSQSPMAMLHVALLYLVIQFLESYLITPLIQREAVSIPPALLLVVQLWLGLFAGMIGLLMAEPLVVVGMVVVERLYVEGWVERRSAASPTDDGA